MSLRDAVAYPFRGGLRTVAAGSGLLLLVEFSFHLPVSLLLGGWNAARRVFEVLAADSLLARETLFAVVAAVAVVNAATLAAVVVGSAVVFGFFAAHVLLVGFYNEVLSSTLRGESVPPQFSADLFDAAERQIGTERIVFPLVFFSIMGGGAAGEVLTLLLTLQMTPGTALKLLLFGALIAFICSCLYLVVALVCSRATEHVDPPAADAHQSVFGWLRRLYGFKFPSNDVPVFDLLPTVKPVVTDLRYVRTGVLAAGIVVLPLSVFNAARPMEPLLDGLMAVRHPGAATALAGNLDTAVLWVGYALAVSVVHFVALTVGLRLFAAGYRAAVESEGGRAEATADPSIGATADRVGYVESKSETPPSGD